MALSWLILASKTPPRPSKTPRRPSKTPPRASKIPPRSPRGRPKNLDFPCVFQGFRFRGPAWDYLGPTWPPRRRQEPPARFQGPPRRLQEPPRRLHKPPKRPQEPPRCAQDTPRELPELCFSQCFSIYSTFLGLLRAILLNMAVKTPSVASKTLQDPPESLQDTPTCLQLRASRPLPRAGSKSLLLRPRPFTKGGLAVVRPRRPSSIIDRTLYRGSEQCPPSKGAFLLPSPPGVKNSPGAPGE